MADCLFCRPSGGDNRIVAESATWYIRLDNYPASPGHVEVVPSLHVESLWELAPQEIAEGFQLADAYVRGHSGGVDGWTVGVNEGRAAGRTVDHLHIHLIPRRWGDVTDPRGGVRLVLPGTDPDVWAGEPNSEAGGFGRDAGKPQGGNR